MLYVSSQLILTMIHPLGEAVGSEKGIQVAGDNVKFQACVTNVIVSHFHRIISLSPEQ